jgi:hypothetical protein
MYMMMCLHNHPVHLQKEGHCLLSPWHCKQDADHEEELADVDDDGKAQRKITNFFQKETREETLARIRREDEQNALTHEQRQRDAEQDKQLKLDKKREDAWLRQQKFRDKQKAIKISEGWTPYQNRAENKVRICLLLVKSGWP